MDFLFDQMVDWLTAAVLACLDGMISLITGALLATPDVTGLPQIQAMTGRAVWIVDTVFVLAFIAAGVVTMAGGGNERLRYDAKDLLPRLVVGFVAAHFSQPLCGRIIELGNAATSAFAGDDLDHVGALGAVKTHLAAARDKTAALLFLVIAAIVVILVATTLVGMIGRIIAVLLLTAVAPLALACHALPQTDPAARLWWRSYLGVLAIPTAQGLLLYAGQWMLLDPDNLLPVLGLPIEPGGMINLFIVVVLLWTTARVPKLMRRLVGNAGRTPSVFGAVVRIVVVEQVGRAIPGLGRAVRGARAIVR
jgi:hypothetical protein